MVKVWRVKKAWEPSQVPPLSQKLPWPPCPAPPPPTPFSSPPSGFFSKGINLQVAPSFPRIEPHEPLGVDSARGPPALPHPRCPPAGTLGGSRCCPLELDWNEARKAWGTWGTGAGVSLSDPGLLCLPSPLERRLSQFHPLWISAAGGCGHGKGKAWVLLLGTGGLRGPFSTDPLTGLVTSTLPGVLSLGWEDPLEEGMAIRSSIFA